MIGLQATVFANSVKYFTTKVLLLFNLKMFYDIVKSVVWSLKGEGYGEWNAANRSSDRAYATIA